MTAELVISELFTNAVLHTDSEQVSCELRVMGARLRVEVADEGCRSKEDAPRSDGVAEENGRGLLLVEACSQAWGVRHGENGRGSVTWVDLPYGAHPGDRAGSAAPDPAAPAHQHEKGIP